MATGLGDLSRAGLPPITDSSWLALDRFMCRPWFRSIQALPACIWAKNLQLTGEDWSWDADMFVAAVINVSAMELPLFGHGINSDEMSRGARCFSFFAGQRIQYEVSAKQLEFSELLQRCRLAEADSTLEKLAIIAAISNRGQDPAIWNRDDGISTITEIDQSTRTVRYFFDNTDEGPGLLSLARGYVSDSTLPSWMPEVFSQERSRSGLDPTVFQSTSIEKPPKMSISKGGRELSIACAPVPCACDGHNLISATTNMARQDSGWLSVISMWQHAQGLWAAMRSPDGERFATYPDSNEPPLEVIWETLRKGKQSDIISAQMQGSMASAKAVFMSLVRDDMREVATQHFENANDAINFLSDQLEGWKFCVMATGYMALVPEEAEAGDEIMAICGARVPFVLRWTRGSDEYQLVGECYVHGIMNGELMSKMSFTTKVLL